MRKIYKILLIIVSLMGIGISVCITSFNNPASFIAKLLKGLPGFDLWSNYIFTGYHIMIGLGFITLLLLAVFIPGRNDFLMIKKSKGELSFSKKTIESAAHYSFKDLDGIAASKVKVKIARNPDKTKIHVKLTVNNINELLNMTETIQSNIESALQSSLSITVKSITVKVVGSDIREDAKDSLEISGGGIL